MPSCHRPISRRRLLRTLGVGLALPGAAVGWAMQVELYWPEFHEIPLPIPNLPDAFLGLRIAHLSDLHIASRPKCDFARAVVEHVNRLGADIAFVTGDLVTLGQGWIDEACEVVNRLEGPTYVSLGNHDYGQQLYHSRTVDTALELERRLEQGGCTVLRNAATELRRGEAKMRIIGLEDLWSGRFSPAQALAGLDAAGPILALSHNPDTGAALDNYGVAWTFAGHTHGGQIRVPGYGAILLPVQNRRLQQGLVTMNGGQMYISRGIGYLTPARLACRPEIPIFVARRA